jgi:hypothetical protein
MKELLFFRVYFVSANFLHLWFHPCKHYLIWVQFLWFRECKKIFRSNEES